jgi:hypothetical protein
LRDLKPRDDRLAMDYWGRRLNEVVWNVGIWIRGEALMKVLRWRAEEKPTVGPVRAASGWTKL